MPHVGKTVGLVVAAVCLLRPSLDWVGLDLVGGCVVGRGCWAAGLEWVRLVRTGLGYIGLAWVVLAWVGLA